MRKKPVISILVWLIVSVGTYIAGASSVPVNVDQFAREFIKKVSQGDMEQIRELVDSTVINNNDLLKLESVFNTLAKGVDTSSFKLIESGTYKGLIGDERSFRFFKYNAPTSNGWLFLETTVRETTRGQKIAGFNIVTIPKSEEQRNAFTLKGKSLTHYVFLGLTIIMPLFMLYTLITCIRTRVERKWLWMGFILLGIGKMSMNWTTGGIHVWLISLSLIGGGASQALPYVPWILSFHIPLGAILFTLKRRGMLARAHNETSVASNARE